jgi:histidinol-phosphate aminotransferase
MFELTKIVRPSILKLKAYSSARDEFSGKEGIFLDANENPFGDLNRYPDPYQNQLKVALSQLKNTPTNSIFIGNGSDEVIDLAFRIFCEPGKDKALTFSPTYGMYDVSAEINNVELDKEALSADFQIDLDRVLPRLKNPLLKLIFICSPNNPTGNSIKTASIIKILENFSGIVIVDEAYIDFSSSVSLIELITKYPNLIVSQTFSKAWGLAAARVGIAYSDPSIISLYNKVKPPYNVSRLNQEAAINALQNKTEFDLNKATLLTEKAKLYQSLKELEIVNKIYLSDANFYLIEVNNADLVYEKLVAQKIIVRNRNKVVDNCIRISIGSEEENNLLIEALKTL